MICLSMRTSIIILLILSLKRSDSKEVCTKPDVKRSLIHIYQIVHNIDVKVYHCELQKYSDVTENCIKAFSSGLFVDKWGDSNYVNVVSSNLTLNEYTTKANLFRNELILKSGTICRYDRGYCYDPKESVPYAAVWEVKKKVPTIDDSSFEQVFYGWVDIWTFKNNQLKYVVYQNTQHDLSFALQLANESIAQGKSVWYTDQYGLVVSQLSLTLKTSATPVLNQAYFPLESKQVVADSVMTSCDLQNLKFPLNFEKEIGGSYMTDPKSLKFILWILQKEIIDSKVNSLNNKRIVENLVNSSIAKLQTDVAETKKILDEKRADVEKILGDLKNTENNLTQKDKDLAELDGKLNNTLDKLNAQNVDFVKVKENSNDALNRISNLERFVNSTVDAKKTYDNLLIDVNKIQNKLTKDEEEIFNNLSSKDKELALVKNGLSDILVKLSDRDAELKKEKEKIFDKLVNLEQTLDKETEENIKCCNESNALLLRAGEKCSSDIDKVENKLLNKFTELSDKLQVTSKEVIQCKNVSNAVLSNDQGINRIEARVAETEKKVGENQNKLLDSEHQLELTRQEIEGIKKILTTDSDGFSTDINKISSELQVLKNQNKKFKDDIEDAVLQSKDFENVRKNLAKTENKLREKDEEIAQLQSDIKDIFNTDKELALVKNGLSDILVKVSDRDAELIKEKEKIFDKLANLEQTLDKETEENIKCCKESKALLSRDINKVENKLLNKFTELSDKLQVTSKEVIKCKNVSNVVLSNDQGIHRIEARVAEAEKKVGENQKKLLDSEYQLELTRQEIEGIKKSNDWFSTDINKISSELQVLKNQNKKFNGNVENAVLQSKDFEKNLTKTENKLREKDEEIAQIQSDIKDIFKKLHSNSEDLNNRQLHVDSKLRAKDVAIGQIHQILIAKDKEIWKLKETLNGMKERENDLEDKILQCKEHAESLANSKDQQLQTLLQITLKVDQLIVAEKKQRDREREEFKKKLEQLEHDVYI